MPLSRHTAALAAAAVIAATGLANPPAARAQGAPPPPPAPSGTLQWTATLRTRAESWNWFDAGGEGRYEFLGSYLRAGLKQQRRGFGWKVELMAPLLLGLPDDAVLPPPQGQLGQGGSYAEANDGHTSPGDVFPKEVYFRIGAASGQDGHTFRVGRLDFSDGTEIVPADPTVARLKRERISQRLLGPFGFTHVMRSYDGAQYALTSRGGQLWLMAARPTVGVFNTDGWGHVDDVTVLYGALTIPAKLGGDAGEARLFALWYEDPRDVLKTDNRPLDARQADAEALRITTLGGHLLQVFPTPSGPVDLLLWGALQTGAWGTLDHSATAAALELGFQPRVAGLRPWLRLGLFRGSGDADPLDADHDTFFQVLPTPRPYARFPFYDFNNTTEVFADLTLLPRDAVTVRAGVHGVRLSEAADLWYVGGGPFEDDTFGYTGRPSGGARGLATVLDLSLAVSPVRWATVEGYAAVALEKNVIRSIYPGAGHGRLAYLEVELRH